jgi:hypothetical protein
MALHRARDTSLKICSPFRAKRLDEEKRLCLKQAAR